MTSNSLYSQTPMVKTWLWGPCKKRSFEGEVRLWFEQVRMQGKETDKKTKSKESIGTMVNSLLSETGKCARH